MSGKRWFLGKADDRFILDDNGIIGMCLFFWLFSL
jgi:hypothetical protein